MLHSNRSCNGVSVNNQFMLTFLEVIVGYKLRIVLNRYRSILGSTQSH